MPLKALNGADEAMFRRYNRWWAAFDQPDPYEGSYNPTDPQSFNRYAYVQNDPVNFSDPTGLQRNDCTAEFNATGVCTVTGGGGPSPIDDPGLFMFVRNSRFGGYPGGTRVGGEPRTPQPNPQPPQENPTTQPNNNQQQGFDSCATSAWRAYRTTYLKTTGKVIGGSVGLGIGLSVMRGAPVAANVGFRSIGFGWRGAMHSLGDKTLTPIGRALTAYMEMKDSGIIGSAFSFFGGGLAWDGIKEANQNTNNLNAALENCKSRFPGANHSATFLNF